MPIPEGYEKLAVIGIVNKGEYSEDGEYKQYNYVYYEGSTYLALRDNPKVPPVDNKTDWQYLARGVVGAKGDKGEPGAKGEQGVSITGAKIVDGVLHITLSDERDITVGSVAITKEAVVDALGYTPAGGQGVNLVSLTNWVNAGVNYAEGYLAYQDNRATSPMIPVENGCYTLSFIQPSDRTLELNVFAWGNTESTYIGVLLDENINEKNILTLNNEIGLIRLVVRGHLPDNDPVDLSLIPQLKIKLEPGIVTDPIWTPSPYDILSSLDDLAARVAALEDKLVV